MKWNGDARLSFVLIEFGTKISTFNRTLDFLISIKRKQELIYLSFTLKTETSNLISKISNSLDRDARLSFVSIKFRN